MMHSFIYLRDRFGYAKPLQLVVGLGLVACLLLTSSPLIAKQQLEQTRDSLLDDGRPVVLQSITIKVKGLSNKTILRNRLGVEISQVFDNLSELRSVLDLGFNKLNGTGYFKKKDGIVYHLKEKTEGSSAVRHIHLQANFQDAWTIFPIVFPYYSTGTGWGFRSRLRWDNFLGLLGKVSLYLNLTQVRDGEYGPDISGGISSSTIRITPYLGIRGSLSMAYDARKKGANGKVGAGIGASLNIPALKTKGISMGYSVSNSSSVTFGYQGSEGNTGSYFSTSFSHRLYLSKTRTSWGGTLRQGYSFSFANELNFDSKPQKNPKDKPKKFALEEINFILTVKLSRAYFDMINFKGRFGLGKSFDFDDGKYQSDGYNYSAKSYNRGGGKRKDGALATGNFIAFLNMDMALLVFSDSLLGDLLIGPFLDLTWVHNADGFSLESPALGSGFDLVWVFNSLKLRFTFGIDLHKPQQYTIAITTGFYF